MRSLVRYCLTAVSVVSQLRPTLIPQTSPVRTSNRRWFGERPLIVAAWLREMSSCRSGGPARFGLVPSETNAVFLECGFIYTIIRGCEISYRLREQGRDGMPVTFLMPRSGVSRAPPLPGTASQSGSQIAPAQRQRGRTALTISLRYEPRKPCRRLRSGALHVAYGPHSGQRMAPVLSRTLASACRRIWCDGKAWV